MAEGKLPVTIITGFLGSGKTTVLSHWLEHPMFQRVSVIVNEFGQAGLDQRVLRQIEEKTVLLSGGCACCNIRDDLVKELAAMIDSRDRGELDVDRVVIETTGLADPAPILFSIMTDSVLRHHYQVDCVVTCLDAVNGSFQLEHTSESVKQIATADKVLLTKTDLAKEEEVPALIERVEEINPSAVILKTDMGEIDPELVLSEEGLPRRERPEIAEAMKKRPAIVLPRKHESLVRSISIGFTGSLSWAAFGLWLSALLYAHGEKIYRVKGLLDTGEGGPVLINGVQHIIHPPRHLENWGGEERRSELVFIMKDIDPKVILDSLQAFQRILGAKAHIRELDNDLSSVSTL
ncbi:GTP-binding protein [Massilistercora timonensis]|uniref:CobW family GTP-binding protein n=1 Tax=Massilistercora timonensis TaxID=2086584 RepID=UPI003209DD0A